MESMMNAAMTALKTAVKSVRQDAREKVLNALKELTTSLEKPIETLDRLCEGQMPLALVKAAVDSGLLKALSESDRPLSSEQLASRINAAPLLTARLLRYVACQGLVVETGVNQFTANEKTRAFADPSFLGTINFFFGTMAPVYQATPALLEETKYQDIKEIADTPFSKAHNTTEPPFVWFESHPLIRSWFMQFMSIQRQGLADWLSVFPVKNEIRNWSSRNSQTKGAVFVDIGGGPGHQAAGFRLKYPELGRVVLQDLPSVIEHAMTPPGVEKQPINFFKEQPEKGAKFYYLRNILHDYSDEKALIILKHIIAALAPESVILIDEMCLPDKGVPSFALTRDFQMGAFLAATERTLTQWQKLFDAAGLRIESKYQYTHTLADTVFVVVPKSRDHETSLGCLVLSGRDCVREG